jgi:glucosyl-3-phosphoglycerate synthase
VGVRTFAAHQFRSEDLLRAREGRRISVCLPARDEEATVGAIVGRVRAALVEAVPLVDEVLVVDDGSSDATALEAQAAGARVVRRGPADGPPGKGQALRRAVEEATGDVLVFLDADVRNFDSHFVVGLLGPVLTEPGTALVKATYRRPLEGSDGPGGRVTELVARPLLARLFPDLSGVTQPLAGECAAPRAVLEAVAFVDGYGVEVGLLIDVAAHCGAGVLAQVDLGERVHRNRPLDELAPQAAAVIDVVLDRAGVGPA